MQVTANVTQTEKDDLAVLAYLNKRSSRDEAGSAIRHLLGACRKQIQAVKPKERAAILALAKK